MRWIAVLIAGLSLALTVTPTRAQGAGQAVVVSLDDAISPATAAYFGGALDDAIDSGARLLILELDTPGGLDSAMRDIIKRILASPIPVVTYVSPSGSRAASAGTYILYASHVAAMAPATNLGAATPIPVGGSPGGTSPDPASGGQPASKGADEAEASEGPASQGEVASPSTASRRKAVSDAVAYIRGLAERRGRNPDWAEKAVREGVSLSADAALAENVIDLVAPSIPALLEAINGRSVEIASGSVTLATEGLTLERIEPDWRVELLSIITNPTVAYILMMIGIYGLLLEGYSPGAVVPGVVGSIALLLALFAFQALPINYAGLALMVLGIALMVAEAFAPSFGALGLGGVAAFVFGSIMLMDTDVPGYGVNLGVIGGIAVVGCAGMGLSMWMFARARQAPVSTASEALSGEYGVADTPLAAGEAGWSIVAGETWKIRPNASLAAGQRFRVVDRDGLELQVESAQRAESP